MKADHQMRVTGEGSTGTVSDANQWYRLDANFHWHPKKSAKLSPSNVYEEFM